MDNQHRKISGYRELSQEEIGLMNEIKAKGEELKELCGRVEEGVRTQLERAAESDEEEYDRLITSDAYGWVNDARKDLQVGIMKLVRAVAQPTTF
jgi:hypothetical protein